MQRLEVVNDLQLIINVPTDKQGIQDFNTSFAKVQATLVKKCIGDLNIDKQSKQKVVQELLTTLKERKDVK